MQEQASETPSSHDNSTVMRLPSIVHNAVAIADRGEHRERPRMDYTYATDVEAVEQWNWKRFSVGQSGPDAWVELMVDIKMAE